MLGSTLLGMEMVTPDMGRHPMVLKVTFPWLLDALLVTQCVIPRHICKLGWLSAFLPCKPSMGADG